MAQFKNLNFSFNGVRSDEFNLSICNIKGNNETFFGVDRSVSLEKAGMFTNTIRGIDYSVPTIELTLVHHKNNKPISFTDEELFAINRWLFNPQVYRPFVSDDNKGIVYYAMFTKGSKWENGTRQGYINVTMQLNGGCAYGILNHDVHFVEYEREVSVYNNSNLGEYNHPDIVVKTVGVCTDVEITNYTTGETMTFKDMPKGINFTCYNENVKHMECHNGDLNIRQFFSGDWLRLAYGRNTISIKCNGACEVLILHQPKIALQ